MTGARLLPPKPKSQRGLQPHCDYENRCLSLLQRDKIIYRLARRILNMETLILSIISLIVALGALGFSFFTYFAHDRELKRLEKIINDFQLSALAREEDELKKAQIRGNIIKTASKGGRELRIYNSGKATAYNVRVEWLNSDDDSTFLQGDISNLVTLTPHNPRSFNLSLNYGHYDTMNLRYIWDDEYQTDNVYQENLQL